MGGIAATGGRGGRGRGCSLPQLDWRAERSPTTRGSPGAQKGTPPWQEPGQECRVHDVMGETGELNSHAQWAGHKGTSSSRHCSAREMLRRGGGPNSKDERGGLEMNP